jgi:peptide/nickel transport system permease protein
VIVVLFGVILFLAAFGPLIAPQPTEIAQPNHRLLAPSSAHWFGTDTNGIDIFSRVLAAPRTDVVVALVATVISLVIGTGLGLVAGYLETSPRRAASISGEAMLRLLDVLQAFPVFIFAMVLVAIRGATVTNLIIAIAFVNFPVFLRLVRTEVLRLHREPYIEAARAIGNSEWRIAVRHVLPNALPPVIVQLSVTIGFAVLLTAGLSFVGAGIAPPTPELGNMISGGASYIVTGQWWASVFPGLALGTMVFVFGAFGEVCGKLVAPLGEMGTPEGPSPLGVEGLTNEAGVTFGVSATNSIEGAVSMDIAPENERAQ